MVIIEGPDGAGKTRLCETLSGEMNLSLAPTYAPRHQMHEKGVRKRVFSGISAMLRGEIYLHDRLYYSELVYGSILRKSIMFDENEMSWISNTLIRFEVPVIICLPSKQVVAENTEPFLSHHIRDFWDNRDAIYDQYALYAQDNIARPYDYTSPHDTIEDLMNWIQPKIDNLERIFGNKDATDS